MKPSAADRLNFRSALADTRLSSRLIYAVVPVLVRDPGFDTDTGSAADVSVGDGLGASPEQFRTYALYANVRNVDQALKTFGQAPPGAEIGDTFITIGLRDQAVLEQVYDQPDAYLAIDGDRFRPSSLSAAGVGHREELVVTLVRASRPHVAPGL